MPLASCSATVLEKRRPLSADAMIPDPIFTSTHAITIDAPPEQVWPWIAQMGSGRAGWYSWDAIDNGGRPSATSIVPALQTVVPGDIMPAVPGAKDAFVVAAVDPPRDLVLTVPDGLGGQAVAWEHHLEPLGSGQTRLIVRGLASSHWLDLARAKPPAGQRRIFIERAYALLARLPRPLLVRFAAIGHRVMEARHLRGLRRRSAAAPRGDVGAESTRPPGTSNSVLSRDGTRISYRSVGSGPSVLVIPGVLSLAADYAAFARALSARFTVHTIERRGRGESGPQGDDYSIVKECEDVLALQAETGASLLVGHSYGGLVALEVARNNKGFNKIAVYEPGVSIDGSMPTEWMPGYEKKLAERKHVDALVEFTLADAPPRIQKTPPWLMKLFLIVLVNWSRQYRQMLGLLHQNLREWREIARLDSSCENYREIAGGVLLMYGGKSDSKAVTLAMERLPAILPRSETKEFPALDHFGIERTAPREVAKAVSDYFLK